MAITGAHTHTFTVKIHSKPSQGLKLLHSQHPLADALVKIHSKPSQGLKQNKFSPAL